MKLVRNDEFKEMKELGFIKKGEYATTMKQHSKAKRHKHYCQEDRYNKYLSWKKKQLKNK